MRPELGLRKPVMVLKRVVLPAPLGPMRPVMLPLATLRLQPSTARTPPNDLVTLSTTRIGVASGWLIEAADTSRRVYRTAHFWCGGARLTLSAGGWHTRYKCLSAPWRPSSGRPSW